MTSKELHKQKIIPLRMKLERLEQEYRKLYRQECGAKIGETAKCSNCAFSCIISVNDHNVCMGGKCICCNNWCYEWIPENAVSKFLRENYHYDYSLFYRLESLFGDNFLKKCDSKEQTNAVMDMLQIVARFDGKATGDGND